MVSPLAAAEETSCRSVEAATVKAVLSVRGPLLTVRKNDTLWVLRAGADPRAWKKRLDEKGNGTGEWQQGRPPLETLLRLPRAFPQAASSLIAECREELDLECDWNDEEREARSDQWTRVAEEGDDPDPTCEGRPFRRGHCKGTGPFPWAWIPGEGERRIRREEPDAAAVGWWRERPMVERDWKRLPPGGSLDGGNHVPVPVTDAAFRALRLTIRRVGLLRRGLPQWAGLFPEGAMEYVERHDFGTRRWHLLNLWLRVPGGRQLWDDLPALAWLAASSWLCKTKPVKRPLRSLRTLVKKPRACLLRWLDLPAGDGTLALLRSVDPSLMTPKFAHALCRVLRDEDKRRAWRNLPKRAAYRELAMLAYDNPVSFPILRLINLGEEAGDPLRRAPVNDIFFDCLKMIAALDGEDRWNPVLARVRSGERLLAFHDELVRELGGAHRWIRIRANGGVDPLGADSAPPPPPLPPPSWMFPMSTWEDLHDEGRLMRHCVASYEPEVAGGRYYVYAVLHSEYGRATLGIRKSWGGSWQLEELRGKCNRNVPEDLRRLVAEWLRVENAKVLNENAKARVRPHLVESTVGTDPRGGRDPDPEIDEAIRVFRERLGLAAEVAGREDEMPF